MNEFCSFVYKSISFTKCSLLIFKWAVLDLTSHFKAFILSYLINDHLDLIFLWQMNIYFWKDSINAIGK